MSKVNSDAAKEAISAADELADMIIFHVRVRKSSEAMMQTGEI